jgi:tetratricopeptide (TPR) repeat protein
LKDSFYLEAEVPEHLKYATPNSAVQLTTVTAGANDPDQQSTIKLKHHNSAHLTCRMISSERHLSRADCEASEGYSSIKSYEGHMSNTPLSAPFSDVNQTSSVTPATWDSSTDSDSEESIGSVPMLTVEPIVLPAALDELGRLIAEHGPRHETVAEAWTAVGLIRLHMQRDALAALKCHHHALEVYKSIHASQTKLAITLNDLGMCYERMGNRKRALDAYRGALELALAEHPTGVTDSEASSVPKELRLLFRMTERAIWRMR